MNDVLFQTYWDKIYPMLSDLMCNAENYEVFGNQDGATESYDMMNDLWYMFVYGQIAFYEQQLKLKNNPSIRFERQNATHGRPFRCGSG